MKNILFLLLIVLFSTCFAQNEALPFGMGEEGALFCKTSEYMQALHQKHPHLPSEEAFEAWLGQRMMEAERFGTSSRAVLTIPIIFHVIHNGEAVGVGSNLSQAQVQSQIDVLNEDFRRAVGTPGFNTDPVGADVEIEFCAALLGPDGIPLSEPGINRIDQRNKNWGFTPYDEFIIDRLIKPATIWKPDWYYNVWVLSTNIGGGYSQFPVAGIVPGVGATEGASTDGTVIPYYACGRVGVLNPGRSGRSMTHQAGHFLGLIHTWGSYASCSADDYCSDTPLQENYTSGCDTNHVSCGSVDMVRNYMDGSSDACQNIFTKCQKSRMRTVLLNAPRRASLLTSPVCALPVAAPVAAFYADLVKCDGTVHFQDSSLNSPFNWFWNFGDGTTSTQQNPVHTYAQPGNYTVTMVSNNMLGSHAASQQIHISFSVSATVDAGPDFSACTHVDRWLNAVIQDPKATYHWSPATFLSDPHLPNPIFHSTQSQTHHVYIVTVTDSTGCSSRDTLDILTHPISPISAGKDSSIQPGASIVLTPDAFNQTFRGWEWRPYYGFLSSNFMIRPTVQPAQTVTYTLTAEDNSGCPAKDSVTITVIGTSPLSVDQTLAQAWGQIYAPYPNPAQQELGFQADFIQSGALSITLYDLQGRLIQRIYEGNTSAGPFELSWQRNPEIPSGLYMVAWKIGESRVVQKVILR